MRRQWKRWHKVTLGIVGGLALCLCGTAVFGAIVGDDEPASEPSPTSTSTPAATTKPAATTPAVVSTPAPATPAPTTATVVQQTSQPPVQNVYYANCAAVRAAGKAPLYRGDPGYRSGLDRDGDGVACE